MKSGKKKTILSIICPFNPPPAIPWSVSASHSRRLLNRNPATLLLRPFFTFCISVITEAELLFAIAKRPEATRLHKLVKTFLLRIEVMQWDRGTAKTYGALRASMEKKGICLSSLDLLIAADAYYNEAILITSDKAFNKITEIKVVDWTQ